MGSSQMQVNLKNSCPNLWLKHEVGLVAASESLFSSNIKGRYVSKKYLFSYQANQLHYFGYFFLAALPNDGLLFKSIFTLSVQSRENAIDKACCAERVSINKFVSCFSCQNCFQAFYCCNFFSCHCHSWPFLPGLYLDLQRKEKTIKISEFEVLMKTLLFFLLDSKSNSNSEQFHLDKN